MRAVAAKELPPGEGWAAELKWDGMRIVADVCVSGDAPELVCRSGNGRDVTNCFPDLQTLTEAVGTDVTLDGEVVVFDDDRPSFARMQQRIHVENPNQVLVTSHPVVYIVFDLLMLDGNSLLDLPYETRRRLLDDLLPDGPNWRIPPYAVDNGEQLLEFARSRGLEGIVVKRLDSRYEPGVRSSAWRKVKIRRRQEFVVGGWLAGQGALENSLGSLVVGVWQDNQLVVAGRVGSGLTDVERSRLQTLLTPRSDPPFAELPAIEKHATWVEPEIVVEVEFGEWPVGAQLRHPTYRGLRIDRDPADVTREDGL